MTTPTAKLITSDDSILEKSKCNKTKNDIKLRAQRQPNFLLFFVCLCLQVEEEKKNRLKRLDMVFFFLHQSHDPPKKKKDWRRFNESFFLCVSFLDRKSSRVFLIRWRESYPLEFFFFFVILNSLPVKKEKEKKPERQFTTFFFVWPGKGTARQTRVKTFLKKIMFYYLLVKVYYISLFHPTKWRRTQITIIKKKHICFVFCFGWKN